MASLTLTLARFVTGAWPELICPSDVWDRGMAELRRRSGGRRESGAFLLGTKNNTRRIREFVFYDDIDPDALSTGIVVIDGRRLGTLWNYCRSTRMEVVADVHVHPYDFKQSRSDSENPVIAEIGHKAIIIPDFAEKSTSPGSIGIYEYLGARRWRDDSLRRFSPLHIGWWPSWQ